LSPSPPALKRKMSNKERSLDKYGDFHVNSQIAGKVNLQTPGHPDHTYSAVAFNVHGLPTGNVVCVQGFGVAGLLRRMRVYICMNVDCKTYREDISQWTLVYDKKHASSWDQRSRLCFDDPVIIPPEQHCAFYIHSDYPDDRGLKYRSCIEGVVHQDGYIAITRGFAHTSPIPFDVRSGWFREGRVLSGEIFYEAVPILWSQYSNNQFPVEFQNATKMLEYVLDEMEFTPGLIDDIIAFCPFTWFDEKTEDVVETYLTTLKEEYNEDEHHYQRRSHWYSGLW